MPNPNLFQLGKPKKFSRRYECDECHAHQYLTDHEVQRAARPKCTQCGCSRLTVSEAGREALAKRRASR